MATKSTTKPAVTEEVTEVETTVEPTTKQLINEGILTVVEATGIDSQKARYKAMRAIAFQAFANAIADGSFEDLVQEAIANADDLPAGWELERVAKEATAKPVKAAAKPAAAKATPAKKAPAKAAAKPAATRRARPAR